jgi:hypothetical protein
MHEPQPALVDFLRTELAEEFNAGFPRLRRVPDTMVFRYLDYFAGLAPADQAELIDGLAHAGARRFFPGPILIQDPGQYGDAFRRFADGTAFRGFGGGLRYTPVKLLAGITADAKVGGLAGWCKMMNFAGLCLQPPEHHLSDPAKIVPVKTPALRKLVNAAFAKLFAPQVRDLGDGICWYDGTLAGSSLRVQLQFGRALEPHQLRYEVMVHSPARSIRLRMMQFEALLGAGYGMWDYITEEHAGRSVELLCELVEYLARLPQRLPADFRTPERPGV